MPLPDHDLNRREFLGAATAASLALNGSSVPSAVTGATGNSHAAESLPPNTTHSLEDNVYTRLLGVRPHLGAHEHISRLGGGRM